MDKYHDVEGMISINHLAILGSTGSIGTQALDVAARHSDCIKIEAIVAYGNEALLREQVKNFRPKIAGLVAKQPGSDGDGKKDEYGCRWIYGSEALTHAATLAEVTDVLVAVTGLAGLLPVLNALSSKKRVLLANKESIVAGGELVMSAAHKNNADVIPIDGEHSAIFQCVQGAGQNKPAHVTLTASGGPFRNTSYADMHNVTVDEALAHPNWLMGKKITIDCATLMNKGLEVIEAHWLFDMPYEDIEVVIHPQSIVHSVVHFRDGSSIAQMSWPDMRVPILYALTYPNRKPTGCPPLDLVKAAALTFEPLDTSRFPCFSLAAEAYKKGGLAPAVLNAANEAAVERFLCGGFPITRIAGVVEEVLSHTIPSDPVSLESVLEADAAARVAAYDIMRKI